MKKNYFILKNLCFYVFLTITFIFHEYVWTSFKLNNAFIVPFVDSLFASSALQEK